MLPVIPASRLVGSEMDLFTWIPIAEMSREKGSFSWQQKSNNPQIEGYNQVEMYKVKEKRAKP